MSTALEDLTAVAAKRRRVSARRALLLGLVVIVALGVWEACPVLLGTNFHTVVRARVYRCAQPSVEELEEMIADYGIRTVVNLRGSCDPFLWYLDETRVVHNHGILHENVGLSAGRLPSVTEIRHLVEILEGTEYPILLHCRRGADRTGVAAAIVLLLTTDTPLVEACSQLSWRYGHVAIGRPAQLNTFLDYYRDWLKTTGQSHSKQAFRKWALEGYRPGSCSCELTLASSAPAMTAAADPTTYHVLARNTGSIPWRQSPLDSAGVHLGCHIYDEQDEYRGMAKTGLRDVTLLPGETVELKLIVQPLYLPGRYRLLLDLVDEQSCWFFQVGSQPLELELIVRE